MAFEAAEAGVLVELLGFAVPEVVGEEFDLAALVFLLAFGGGDDGEKFPVGVMDCVFEFTPKGWGSGVGVRGFDEVVGQAEEEGAVAGAHEGFGGFWVGLVLVEGEAAVLVGLF